MMRRGFVECGGRHVHWRAMGRGPVVVMLHASPRSSTSLVPLMEHLSSTHCCLAFDTPGYGASDALAERFAPIEDFARAILEAVTALGVDNFHLYGSHTGGAIALELALRAPERVASLLLDGLAMFSGDEQRTLLDHYLPPQPPEWDGGHLMRIWSRIRDQALFFPFYDRSPAARLSTPNHDLEFMVQTCIGFLEAGDHYRDGYRAAIELDAHVKLSALNVPTRLHVIENDLLAGHLERAEGVNGAVDIENAPLAPTAWRQATRDWFAARPTADASAGDLPQARRNRFVDTPQGPVYAVAGTGDGLWIQPFKPDVRPNGVYGPPANAGDAKWFVDAPGFGVNADSMFDIDAVAVDLNCRVVSSCADAEPFFRADLNYDGGFLTSSWFAVRDSLFFSPWADKQSPVKDVTHVDVDGIAAGHLALVYTLAAQRQQQNSE